MTDAKSAKTRCESARLRYQEAMSISLSHIVVSHSGIVFKFVLSTQSGEDRKYDNTIRKTMRKCETTMRGGIFAHRVLPLSHRVIKFFIIAFQLTESKTP